MFCKYKDMFGKPNEGLHKYRIFDIAIVDVVMTIIAAYLITLVWPEFHFTNVLMVLFLLAILMHRLFCVRTTIDKLLFKN